MRIKLLFITSLLLTIPFCISAAENTKTDEILQQVAELEAENKLTTIDLQEKVNRLELEKKQLEYEQAIKKMKLGEVAAPQDGSVTIKDDFQILQRILSEKSIASMATEIGEHIRANCNKKTLIITNDIEEVRKKIAACSDMIEKMNDLEKKIDTLIPSTIPSPGAESNITSRIKAVAKKLESIDSGIIDLANLAADVFSTKRTRTGSLFIAPPNWFEISKIAITNKIGFKKILPENGLKQFSAALEEKINTCKKRLKAKTELFDTDLAAKHKEIYIASYALDLANKKALILRKKDVFNEIESAFARFCAANQNLKECMDKNSDVILLARCDENFKILKAQIASESPDLLTAAFVISKGSKSIENLLSPIKILEIFPPKLGGYIDTSTSSFKSTKVRETGGGKFNFTLYDYQFNPEIAGFVAFTNIQKNLKSIKIESVVSRNN